MTGPFNNSKTPPILVHVQWPICYCFISHRCPATGCIRTIITGRWWLSPSYGSQTWRRYLGNGPCNRSACVVLPWLQYLNPNCISCYRNTSLRHCYDSTLGFVSISFNLKGLIFDFLTAVVGCTYYIWIEYKFYFTFFRLEPGNLRT